MKSGPLKKQIRRALLDAFRTPSEMTVLVSDADIGITFAEFLAVPGTPYSAAVFSLLDWAESQDKLLPLLLAARVANPGNPLLQPVVAPLVALEAKYQALRPEANLGLAEKLIFTGFDFEDAAIWLDDMAKKRRAVCRIEPRKQTADPSSLAGYGTGFLVAPDVVMTNDHVACEFYDDPARAKEVVFRFDFETGPDGKTIHSGKEHRLHPTEWRIVRSEEAKLDFALLRLAGPAGEDIVGATTRGYLTPAAYSFNHGEGLVILQHPMGAPLKLALGAVDQPLSLADRVSYTVHTQGGSSGSPCFTQQRVLAAVHQAAGNGPKNQGVRMTSILAFLKGLPDAERKRLTDAGLASLLV